ATFGDQLAAAQKASSDVVALQTQVKTVTDQLAAVHQISPDELKAAVDNEVKATFGDQLAAAQKASNDVATLQTQVKTLTDQLAPIQQNPPEALKAAVASAVSATLGNQLAAAQKAVDQIGQLQTMVKALSDQIAARPGGAAVTAPAAAKTARPPRPKKPGE